MADGWVTRENLPLGGEQQLEMTANAPYAIYSETDLFAWREARVWLASW